MSTPGDELKQSLDNLRKAADTVADKILGNEIAGHLREAAKHGLRAAKAAIDEAEKRLDRKPGASHGGGCCGGDKPAAG